MLRKKEPIHPTPEGDGLSRLISVRIVYNMSLKVVNPYTKSTKNITTSKKSVVISQSGI